MNIDIRCCINCGHSGTKQLYDFEKEQYVDIWACNIDHPHSINGPNCAFACEEWEE